MFVACLFKKNNLDTNFDKKKGQFLDSLCIMNEIAHVITTRDELSRANQSLFYYK